MALGMNIQYGNMNPLQELPDRIAQGIGLGLAIRRQNREEEVSGGANLNVSDPGQRPVVDMEKAFAKESQYLNRMADVDKHLNKVSDPIAKEGARQSIINRWDEPITREAIKSGMNVKDLQNTLSGVMNNDPASVDRLDALIAQSGGSNSKFAQAIRKKEAEVQSIQNQLDQEYALKLKTHLMGIKEFRKDPRKFAFKGQAGQEVLQYNSQAGERLLELAKIPGNEQWVKAWLDDEQKRIGRGGAGRANKEYAVFSSDGKQRFVFDAPSADEARKVIDTQYPEYDSSTIKSLGREEEALKESAINPALRGNQSPQPKTSSKKKVASDATIQEYIRKYGKDKALDKLKADGYE